MSGTVADRKRLIRITTGNLKNKSISIAGHYDFFPPDCLGASRKSAHGHSKPIQIWLEGLNRLEETDLPVRSETGKPRGILRGRSWLGEFFRYHGIETGGLLELERQTQRCYCLRPARQNSDPDRAGVRPRAAEFFAGIGLVRLALEKEGWQVVFANDIDPDKAEIYRANFSADHFKLGDIHKLTPADIPDCELFTLSFPCNDLSIAGSWKGLNGKESSAF